MIVFFLRKSQQLLFDAPVHVAQHVRSDGVIVAPHTRIQKVAAKKPKPVERHAAPKPYTPDLFESPPPQEQPISHKQPEQPLQAPVEAAAPAVPVASEAASVSQSEPARADPKGEKQSHPNPEPAAKPKTARAPRKPKRDPKEVPAQEPVKFGDDLPDNSVIRDSDGKQYRVHYMRNYLIVAHPIVDGKPQVSADTSIRFRVSGDALDPGERGDPVYLVSSPADDTKIDARLDRLAERRHDRTAPFGVPAGIGKPERRAINAKVAKLVADGQADPALMRQYSGNGGCGDSLNEYYTDPGVARAMWDTIERLSGTIHNALEPSCATGVFLHTAPPGVKVTGVEIEPISAACALALHGDRHEIHTASFERFATSDDRRFDVVIGNPPYGPRGFLAKDDKVAISTCEQYFTDTAIDKCRAGGVIALVVPTGIVDSSSGRAFRESILRRAEFLGAQRMPNTAFEHSHTEVTTDVIYLRKRPDDVSGALSVASRDTRQALGAWDDEFVAGNYFTGRGASNVLGTMTEGWRAKAGMGNDITVEGSMQGVADAIAKFVPDSEDRGATSLTLADVLAALPEDERPRAIAASERVPYQNTAKVGDTKTVDGVNYVLQGDPPRWHRVDEFMADEAIAQGKILAQRIDNLMTGGGIGDSLQQDLRDYVAKFGVPADNANLMVAAGVDKQLFRLVGAINRKGELSDAVLGVAPRKIEGSLDTIAEALSLEERGDFTVKELADKIGQAEDEVADRLAADKAYAYVGGGRWTTMHVYLTGDLWKKLDALNADAPEDGLHDKREMQRKALEDKIDAVSLEDADIKINHAFLPLHVIEAYFNWRQFESDKHSNEWTKKQQPVTIKFDSGAYEVEGGNTWGDTKLLDKYLNRAGVKKDDVPTIDAWNREFKDWLCGSAYRDAVEELYNRKFRGFEPREFSDAPIDVPGLTKDRDVRSWRWSSLRRSLADGKGIIADDVGLGKTLAALLLARMAKVDGRAKRPIIVVPKSVLANWFSESQVWFPGSRVLTIGANFSHEEDGSLVGRDDSATERKRKYHDLTQNDYDFVLISEPAFEEVDLDPATKERYYSEDFWVQRGEKMGNAGDKRRKKIREAYEQSLATREFKDRTDAIWFDQLGVDLLIADEMHHCFPPGTLVDGVPVESLQPGDLIRSFNHDTGEVQMRPVVAVAAMPARKLCRVHLSNGQSIVSTDNHRFFTLQAGYVEAVRLKNSFDVIVGHGQAQENTQQKEAAGQAGAVRTVRNYIHDEWRTAVERGEWEGINLLLQPKLRGDMARQAAGFAGLATHAGDEPQAQRCADGAQLAADASGKGKEDGCAWPQGSDQSERTVDQGREWAASVGAAGHVGGGARLEHGARREDRQGEPRRLPNALQAGHREPVADGRDRGGRREPRVESWKGKGRTEDSILEIARVVRIEIFEPGRDGEFERLCPQGLVYDIEVEGNHNFFAEGVLVHNSKNLYAARSRFGEQPKFLGGQGLSNRALDFNLKTRLVRDQNGGKGVYGLTATPTKNSPLEIYSMLSHIAPEAFEKIGIRNSEEFLDRFCEFTNDKVLSTTGDIEDALVVSGFKNMDELRQIMTRYIDRRTAEDVGLKLPKRSNELHLVDMSPAQQAVYAELREMAEAAKEKDSTGDAHIFAVMDKMNKAALDLQLLGPEHAGASSPKYAAIAKQCAAGAKEGAQIVFSEYIDSHERLAAALVDAGIPRNRIGIINAHVAASSVKRQNIAEALNKGKLDVVIGNATMAEGLNMQVRTTDIHHADVPWEPATLQQRNGRGLRQGNKNEAIRIHTYLSKGSFDGYRHQSVGAKKDWQDLIWNGGDRVDNLAREGKFTRDEMRIMLAADPEAARAEFEKDAAAAKQRHDAGQREEAVAQYVKFQDMQRGYAALKNKDTTSATRLRAKLDAAKNSLFNNAYFPAKTALDSGEDVLIEPSTGLVMRGGVAFHATSKDGASEGKFVVTGVNMRAGTVTVRKYGDATGAKPRTVPLSELAHGIKPFDFDKDAEAAEVKVKLESAAAEKVSSIASFDDLKSMPSHVIEANHESIQQQLKAGIAAHKISLPYVGDNMSMINRETGDVEKVASYDVRKMVNTHDFLLPTEANKEKLIQAYMKARRGAKFTVDTVNIGGGRSKKTRSAPRRNYEGAHYNAKSVNPFRHDLRTLSGETGYSTSDSALEKEAKRRLVEEQTAKIRHAGSFGEALAELIPLGSIVDKAKENGEVMGARSHVKYPKKALTMLWALARRKGVLRDTLNQHTPKKDMGGGYGKYDLHASYAFSHQYGASVHEALLAMARDAGYDDLVSAMVESGQRHKAVANPKGVVNVLQSGWNHSLTRLQALRRAVTDAGIGDESKMAANLERGGLLSNDNQWSPDARKKLIDVIDERIAYQKKAQQQEDTSA